MLSKLFASWLVLLVVAPFTAPFSTCDVTSLLGRPAGPHAPVARRHSAASTTEVAVLTALFLRTAGRVRLLPLYRVRLTESSAAILLAATSMSSVNSSGSIQEHTVLTTVLRI